MEVDLVMDADACNIVDTTITKKKSGRPKKGASTDVTEIVMVIDRSGSMAHLTEETVEGFNNFVDEQKKLPGNAHITVVLFNTEHETWPTTDIKRCPKMTAKKYSASGGTALLDALGNAILNVSNRLDSNVQQKVIVVVMTDGEENSSTEYSINQIRDMVNEKTRVNDWKFIFLGANIDAFTVGAQYGVAQGQSTVYTSNAVGVRSAYVGTSAAVASYRITGDIDETWKKEIK
jgi:Mg-chelatase subunit ChlD